MELRSNYSLMWEKMSQLGIIHCQIKSTRNDYMSCWLKGSHRKFLNDKYAANFNKYHPQLDGKTMLLLTLHPML